jgi:hypothetical protein
MHHIESKGWQQRGISILNRMTFFLIYLQLKFVASNFPWWNGREEEEGEDGGRVFRY